MEPIIKLARSIIEGNTEQMDKMMKSVGVALKSDEKEIVGKQLLKVVMSRWLNAADIILEMMVLHLPSPKVA
jgi:elongation factor 2